MRGVPQNGNTIVIAEGPGIATQAFHNFFDASDYVKGRKAEVTVWQRKFGSSFKSVYPEYELVNTVYIGLSGRTGNVSPLRAESSKTTET